MLAWLAESLSRRKRLPDPKALLETFETKKPQNRKQLKTMLYQIADHYGLKVRSRKKKARRG